MMLSFLCAILPVLSKHQYTTFGDIMPYFFPSFSFACFGTRPFFNEICSPFSFCGYKSEKVKVIRISLAAPLRLFRRVKLPNQLQWQAIQPLTLPRQQAPPLLVPDEIPLQGFCPLPDFRCGVLIRTEGGQLIIQER